jgi:hypothetical protein
MLLRLTLMLLLSATQPHSQVPSRTPPDRLSDIATILAHDEGWPLGNPDFTLDPMTPVADDGFDSIGIYKKAHLVRMYSIDRTTGQIVDFMRGCEVFRFPDLAHFEQSIRAQTNAAPLTDQQLAKKAGCPKLTVVNTRWVKTP